MFSPRELVSATYKPPQVPDEQAMDQVVNGFSFDYRRVFIEHPRVRTDGVYIAVCHYVRHGLGDNPWVNVRVVSISCFLLNAA